MFVERGIEDAQGLTEIAKTQDEDEFLRLEAISFLCLLKVEDSLEDLVLIANSKSESVPVRRSAIIAIYSFHPENIYEIMRPLLVSDSLEEIRYSVVLGYGLHPVNKLFGLLTEVIFSDPSTRVRGEAVRQVAAYCIDEEKSNVFEILVQKLREQREDTIVQAFALEGFAHLLDPRALGIVMPYLANPAPEFRLMAAYSLGHLGDTRHIPVLKEMADDSGVLKGWGTVAEAVEEAVDRIQEKESE